MVIPLLIDANMNSYPDDSISKHEPCTLNNSEKKLYNAIINTWSERLRQQRFEAHIAMEKETQAVNISCRACDQVAYSPEKQTASKLRASDEEDYDLRNHEVSGTAAHFAREIELRARRAAVKERRQGQKRKRDGERSDCRLQACRQEKQVYANADEGCIKGARAKRLQNSLPTHL